MLNYAVTPDEAYFYGTELFKQIKASVLRIDRSKMYPFTAEGMKQSQIDLTGGTSAIRSIVKIADK
jgi:NADPH:quinone reductase